MGAHFIWISARRCLRSSSHTYTHTHIHSLARSHTQSFFRSFFKGWEFQTGSQMITLNVFTSLSLPDSRTEPSMHKHMTFSLTHLAILIPSWPSVHFLPLFAVMVAVVATYWTQNENIWVGEVHCTCIPWSFFFLGCQKRQMHFCFVLLTLQPVALPSFCHSLSLLEVQGQRKIGFSSLCLLVGVDLESCCKSFLSCRERERKEGTHI